MKALLKWLDDNPLGIALGALCGVLLLALLLLTVLSALPLPSHAPEGEAGLANDALQIPVLPESLPIDSYAVITERPVFSESRLPAIHDEVDPEDVGFDVEDDFVGTPEVELSGVVITPTLRMVMLKRKDDAKSLVAFVGKPIEADFGTWQVSSIEARSATLTSQKGEELRLEMKVHDAKIEQPERPVEPKREQPEAEELQAAIDKQLEDTEPVSRAEEIRQRIAERREALKREAEQAEQGESQAEPQSYQQAIQSLMGSKSGTKTNNDDQQ